MISVILPADTSRLYEIYVWLGTCVVDHWAVSRLTVDKIMVDFWGPSQEEDVVAFKLRFKL